MDEVRAVLELATDEELEALTNILFSRKFNPLDYVCTPSPIDIQAQDREEWLDSIEERFRFLAADGLTVLRGRSGQISYHRVLIQICRYLKIVHSPQFSIEELEAEIFLTLLERAWNKLPKSERKVLSGKLQKAMSHSEIAKQIPPSMQQDPIKLLLKGGGALAVNSIIRPWLLQQFARQFALHAATYQVASQTLVKTGVAAASKIQSQAALQMASRGMALNAARYGAVRSAFAFLGPALWVYFFADLGWRAIATNYGRIIPVVFTLAQIRLTRSLCYEMAGS